MPKIGIIHAPGCPDILLYVVTVIESYYPTYKALVN